MGTFEGDFVFYMCHCSILTCMPGGGGGGHFGAKILDRIRFLGCYLRTA